MRGPSLDDPRTRPHNRAALERVGQPGSRLLLPTPALVCDLDALEANLAAMADLARGAGVALRPHAKTHKSLAIARRQLDHGAAGIAVAKLSEAEALAPGLADAGTPTSILVTSPVAGETAARRVAALARVCDLAVVVDRPSAVDNLAADIDTTVTVLCDVDVRLGRSGVRSPADALDVARRVANCARLRFGGVQGYAGHLQHIADPAGANRRLHAGAIERVDHVDEWDQRLAQ